MSNLLGLAAAHDPSYLDLDKLDLDLERFCRMPVCLDAVSPRAALHMSTWEW